MTRRIALRCVTREDIRLIFTWRNLPEIIALGSLQRAVSWEEHERWYSGVLARQEPLLRIVELAGVPIGQVRFDLGDEDDAVVSIYLLPGYTHRGFGIEALDQACLEVFARWSVARVLAFVRVENVSSQAAFRKAGFVPAAQEELHDVPKGHVAFQLARPADVPHNRLTHDEREVSAVADVVRSGQWSAGPRVKELERALAEKAGVRGAVCVGSGVGAIRLALLALGVADGDEVAMPAYSCVALANAALALRARPVAIDVHEGDLNLDAQALARSKARPKAVIAVHTFGVPADFRGLPAETPIVEDCSHAFGLASQNRPLGARGRLSVISLHATKLVGAGQGGAVLSDDLELLEIVRDYSDYTDKSADGLRLNEKMSDLCAAVGLCQLERLPDFLQKRQSLAQRYDERLRAVGVTDDAAILPDAGLCRVWYRYAVMLRRPCARMVVEHMARLGVRSALPVDPWSANLETACPAAWAAYRSVISLPLYPTLDETEQERVVYAFAEACRTIATV